MSEERGDIRAAAGMFKGIFDEADKKIAAELKKIFINSALRYARATKRGIKKADGAGNTNQFCSEVLSYIRSSYAEVNRAKDADNVRDKVSHLGGAFGSFIVVVDLGLTSRKFNVPPSDFMYRDAVSRCREMASALKEMGKKIKPEYIESKIKRIAKKHAGELTDNQKELLATIAAIFKEM